MAAPIEVRHLEKVYRVHEREAGLAATVRSLVKRRFKEVPAVEDVSFDIGEGERVGFLGPNGAGKTTTLKMLAGCCTPPRGEARVLGSRRGSASDAFLRAIMLVMGQSSSCCGTSRPPTRFELTAIYDVPSDEYRATLDELIELLELEPLLDKPVRQLSPRRAHEVRARGRALHRPRVLFLDEPTIGLDVTMQAPHARVHPPTTTAARRDGPAHQPLHGRRRGARARASSSSTTADSSTTARWTGLAERWPPTS